MKIGTKVRPRTPAGLQLGDVPTNGDHAQKRNVTCVFLGVGEVIKTTTITIDYDTWPGLYEGIGKVRYVNCLVKCEAGTGWAGEGALIRA